MKNILSALGLVLFGIVLGIGGMRFAQTESALDELVEENTPRPERTADGRLALYYTADERAHISEEMLAFLQGVQTLNSAVVDGDRETIQVTADSLRRGNGQGRGVQMKSPEGFRRIGQSLRQDFGAIADMSMTASLPDIQEALGNAMTKCVACHGSYKAVEVDDETSD